MARIEPLLDWPDLQSTLTASPSRLLWPNMLWPHRGFWLAWVLHIGAISCFCGIFCAPQIFAEICSGHTGAPGWPGFYPELPAGAGQTGLDHILVFSSHFSAWSAVSFVLVNLHAAQSTSTYWPSSRSRVWWPNLCQAGLARAGLLGGGAVWV